MLKLNASFSKKVPGTQQYSSEGFMASEEVELPDSLNCGKSKDTSCESRRKTIKNGGRVVK